MTRSRPFPSRHTETDHHMNTHLSTSRRIALGSAVVGLALLLAGCSAAAAPSSAGQSAQSARGAQGAGSGGPGGGGIVGQIAAVTGSTLQVQSQSEQTAVDVTASTTVLQTAKSDLSAVTVGSCIVASTFGAPGSTATAAPSGTVTTVSITPAANGKCTGGFRGGARQGGRNFTASPRPSAPRNRTFTPPVAGLVSAVSGSTITVTVTGTGGTTSSKTVTTGTSTTFTLTRKATPAALTVGRCAAVRGSADSSGAVTATSVTVSDPVAGSCTTGFGRRGGFGGGFGGNGGGNGTPASGNGGGNA